MDSLVEKYVRDHSILKPRVSIRRIGNDITLYFKNVEKTAVRDLTINYSLSKMTVRQSVAAADQIALNCGERRSSTKLVRLRGVTV